MTTTNYTYWKSTYTGEVYRMPDSWIPQFGGWKAVTAETYYKANNTNP